MEKMQSSEKEYMRERNNRTTTSYYPQQRIEEEPEEKEDKGLTTLVAESKHEKRAEAYRSNCTNIDV